MLPDIIHLACVQLSRSPKKSEVSGMALRRLTGYVKDRFIGETVKEIVRLFVLSVNKKHIGKTFY